MKSDSRFFEDEVTTFVKDLRRMELIVTCDTIIEHVNQKHPEFTSGKTHEALRNWCYGFMKRNKLSIRRITYSGWEPMEDLELIKEEFIKYLNNEIKEYICDIDGLPFKNGIFNIDQTSIFYNDQPKSTVNVVGSPIPQNEIK